MQIRQIVLERLAATVERSSPIPFPADVTDATPLDEFWLDSVAFAGMIGSLEKRLGYVPRVLLEAAYFPQTVGALVAIYEESAPPEPANAPRITSPAS
jgi:acyl carrier protein